VILTSVTFKRESEREVLEEWEWRSPLPWCPDKTGQHVRGFNTQALKG
jgi:hypothetical protein